MANYHNPINADTRARITAKSKEKRNLVILICLRRDTHHACFPGSLEEQHKITK
jgi:hypothetical protein